MKISVSNNDLDDKLTISNDYKSKKGHEGYKNAIPVMYRELKMQVEKFNKMFSLPN